MQNNNSKDTQDNSKKRLIPNFLDVQVKFMQATAMWPIDYANYLPKKVSCLSSVISGVFYLVVLFISCHIAILHAITSVNTLGGSLDDMSDFFTLTIIYTFTFFIVSYFLVRQAKCLHLFKYLNQYFRTRSALGTTYITAETSYRTTRLCIITWIILCIAGVTLWAAYPILVSKRILPLRCHYPFDELQPFVYEGLYIIQFLGQIEVGLAFGMVSGLYMSLVMLICGQFDILFCSLKNIHSTALLMSGNKMQQLRDIQLAYNKEAEDCNQYFFKIDESLENLEEAHRKLKLNTENNIYLMRYKHDIKWNLQLTLRDCIKHHEVILTVCKMMEDFYNPFCLIKSLQVTFQICFLAFVFVNTAASVVRTVNLAQYMFLTLAELLIFTYYGEVLQQQSVRVGDALIRSPWHIIGPKLRKEFLILLPRLTRPVRLTGGKFFNMDVERFRVVVGTGFSYFTLLQNIGA